jgi:hypothetical protein
VLHITAAVLITEGAHGFRATMAVAAAALRTITAGCNTAACIMGDTITAGSNMAACIMVVVDVRAGTPRDVPSKTRTTITAKLGNLHSLSSSIKSRSWAAVSIYAAIFA